MLSGHEFKFLKKEIDCRQYNRHKLSFQPSWRITNQFFWVGIVRRICTSSPRRKLSSCIVAFTQLATASVALHKETIIIRS